MVQLFFDRIENIVGKGENAGNQHFLLFLKCFHNAFFQGSLKDAILWYMVKMQDCLLRIKKNQVSLNQLSVSDISSKFKFNPFPHNDTF